MHALSPNVAPCYPTPTFPGCCTGTPSNCGCTWLHSALLRLPCPSIFARPTAQVVQHWQYWVAQVIHKWRCAGTGCVGGMWHDRYADTVNFWLSRSHQQSQVRSASAIWRPALACVRRIRHNQVSWESALRERSCLCTLPRSMKKMGWGTGT